MAEREMCWLSWFALFDLLLRFQLLSFLLVGVRILQLVLLYLICFPIKVDLETKNKITKINTT